MPAAHGVAPLAAWYGQSSLANTQYPGEGPSLARRATQDLLKGGLTRSAREERRDQGGGTSSGSHDVTRDDQGKAGASGRRVPVASLVLKGQVQARSPEASGKGFHIGATRPRPVGRQDGGHYGAHDGVTTRAFGRRRPPFVRIACTSCPPSNWSLWDPFPPNIFEEDQGLYK